MIQNEDSLEYLLSVFLKLQTNPNSRNGYRSVVGRAIEYLGGSQRRPSSLRPIHISEWAADCVFHEHANNGTRYALTTQASMIKKVNAFLAWCHQQRETREDLSGAIAPPAAALGDDPRTRAWTPLESERLMQDARGELRGRAYHLRDHAMWMTAHDTGARAGSLARLCRGYINFTTGEVRLYNTKRYRWYTSRVGRHTLELLKAWTSTGPDDDGAGVFSTRPRGALMRSASVSQTVTRARTNRGVEVRDLSIHGWRHFLIVRMAEAGASKPQIAAALNDTQDVADRYYMPAEVHSAIDILASVSYETPGVVPFVG